MRRKRTSISERQGVGVLIGVVSSSTGVSANWLVFESTVASVVSVVVGVSVNRHKPWGGDER
jgi:hypothetical protein